jgi:hypothetical protein
VLSNTRAHEKYNKVIDVSGYSVLREALCVWSVSAIIASRISEARVRNKIHRQAEVSNFAQTFVALPDMTTHRRGLCRAFSHGKANAMEVPAILHGESRTRLLQGIAFGVVATLIIGFSWGGWVTGGTAKTMAATAETKGEMSVLVPLCVTQFMATDGAVAKLKLTQYGHDDVVREFVKKVVDTDMDYSFARACASGVDDAITKTAAKG